MALIDTIISGETRVKSYPHCTLKVITAPVVEPITVDEAKQLMRVRIVDQDALISRLLKAARIVIEKITGRSFVETIWEQHQDYPDGRATGSSDYQFLRPTRKATINLYRKPALSVTGIEYIANWDSETRLTFAATNYVVAIQREEINLKDGASWPDHREYQSLITTFTAGYYHLLDGSVEEKTKAQQAVPENYKLAIAEYAAYLYADPEGIASEIFGRDAIPKQVRQLLGADIWRLK